MKACVIVFPGSNCDKDIGSVLTEHWGITVEYVWHRNRIDKIDLVILPGGFSYGDYLRSGAMATFSPAMESVRDFARKGGKVLGICNGFQILTEAHLLPGALVSNLSLKYICRDEDLLPVFHPNGFWKDSRKIPNLFRIPIAHGEGRYYADPDTLKRLEENGQIVFRYKNNPNGSLNDIAGICSEKKNIIGMMPHPERAVNPFAGLMDGKVFFDYFLGM